MLITRETLFSHSVLSSSFQPQWTAALQFSLSFTISQNLLKLMSIESVMLSNHRILCCLLFLLPSIFPSIRVFSNESALRIRWPKYWKYTEVGRYTGSKLGRQYVKAVYCHPAYSTYMQSTNHAKCQAG